MKLWLLAYILSSTFEHCLGAAHTVLSDYWSRTLGKQELFGESIYLKQIYTSRQSVVGTLTYCIRHSFHVQIFSRFWTRCGNSWGLNFMIFLMFSLLQIDINCSDIFARVWLAKITTYTVRYTDCTIVLQGAQPQRENGSPYLRGSQFQAATN